jgi:hypothetical protein
MNLTADMVGARSVESWFERFGRRIPEIHATAGAIESLEDVVAMHPDLLQPVAIEKTNPHRYGYGSGRFSTYSPFHLVRVPEPNPKPE